jgi:flagellar motor protein MotB
VYAVDHFFYSEIIKIKSNLPATLLITLAKAEPGAVADIGNLFFVGNQAVLLPKSEPELPKVQRFLEVNAHLKVEIAGHVNYPNRPPVTEDSDEWDLSVRRARMVYDYVIQHGIPPAQVSYQGYGNHEMHFPNAQAETEQAQNRRVEIRVVGKM